MNISGGKTKRVALGLQNQKFQPGTGKWHENKTLTVQLLAGVEMIPTNPKGRGATVKTAQSQSSGYEIFSSPLNPHRVGPQISPL